MAMAKWNCKTPFNILALMENSTKEILVVDYLMATVKWDSKTPFNIISLARMEQFT